MSKLRTLINKLNEYRDAYYNKNTAIISDKEYDELYDRLIELEKSTGIIYPDSPSCNVGYTVQSELAKVKHDHPMLSLNKTKDVNDLIKFYNDHNCIIMLKMDGLTVSISYDSDGNLVKAETRGNGIEGEDVTENIKCVTNVPQHISKGPYTIDGEVIMTYDTFNELKKTNPDFKHPRNIASGSLRQLDTKITADRNLKFVAWRVIDGSDYDNMLEQLVEAEYLGFTVVPFISIVNDYKEVFEEAISELKTTADELKYPIDGMVISYNDIAYGLNLGNTSHHPRHSLAYKLYDEEHETVLRDIEWNTTRSGIISPVAIFDPVDLDGAITTRATLHNISIMKELELGIGDTISVIRSNQVIPKVIANYTRSNSFKIPDTCPCCGSPTVVRNDGIAEVLYCTNESCGSRILSRFVHFVNKAGANIDGLSEATLNMFIENGFIRTFKDLYHLDSFKNEIIFLDGFGEKSYAKLMEAIDNSRNIKLENFINALGIPNVGISSAREISKAFKGDFDTFYQNIPTFDFTQLKDFGDVVNTSIKEWYNNRSIDSAIEDEFNFIKEEEVEINNNFIKDKTFVVTGAFKTMKRAELEKLITDAGGKLTGSVSKKTNYLLTNETAGTTKYNKAIELGIPILSEEDFLAKYNEAQ